MRRFGGQMLLVASRLLRSQEDRIDAVQECFLSALQAIGKFEGKSTLGTWLHRIVVNACLMKLRARTHGVQASIDGLLPQFDESGHHAQSVRRWSNTPDERLIREETRSLVRSCIDRLPEDYRTVLLLRDIEELSTDEAAAILGAAPGTVKTRLHRVRASASHASGAAFSSIMIASDRRIAVGLSGGRRNRERLHVYSRAWPRLHQLKPLPGMPKSER